MRINNNMMAMNTHRQLGSANSGSAKSIEKLSSGYRINRAGDDAAGLSISEKMRGQIRGLNQASANSQDGISMIQTAEGALGETHSILQRMRELAVQSSNDTNVDVDREAIQNEMNQLSSEINRIGNTTEFNTKKLLDGGGVDATTKKTGASIQVPASLSGGIGAAAPAVQQKVVFTITEALTDAAGQEAANGKTIEFTLGDNKIELTLNNGLTAANSTDTQVGISDVTSADHLSKAIEVALKKVLEERTDIADNYALGATGTGTITIDAKAYTFGSGKATGLDHGANSTIKMQTEITSTEAVTAGQGSRASASIDFTGKKASDLTGTSLVIDGKEVAFFDSKDGKYNGAAAFKVDLNGAGNAEAIVDRIVSELYNSTGAANVKGGVSAAAGASYLTKVQAIKDPSDGNKLTLMAATEGGATGNGITLEYDSPVKVTNFIGSDKLKGESVKSARGLEDGQHSVKITHNAASAKAGAQTTAATNNAVSVGTTTAFDSGTYRLTNANSTADNVQLQKLGADATTWTTVEGYSDITMAIGANTIGDLSFTGAAATDFTAAVAGTNSFEFTIQKEGYSASLNEAGGSSTDFGADVVISSGQENVTLKAKDGVGEVTINVGDIAKDLAVGANTQFSFTSKAGEVTEEVVGGTFEASLQIGANSGQSMTVTVGDMRSQALGITGKTAEGPVKAKNGVEASYVKVENVSDGTDKDAVEFGLDVSNHEKASAAVSVINDAIEKVSAQRSELGSFQNRLEHTIKNLDTSSENLQSAESRIRDVDMAKEMMEQTKQNILSQAATAMLAQANQHPQGVLQLLR